MNRLSHRLGRLEQGGKSAPDFVAIARPGETGRQARERHQRETGYPALVCNTPDDVPAVACATSDEWLAAFKPKGIAQ